MTFIISGSNICARHNFLFDTIGVLPEETNAYNLIIWLIYSSHSCLLLLTIIEKICFFLYNSKCHPFKMILQIEGIKMLYQNIFVFNCNHFLVDGKGMVHPSAKTKIAKTSNCRYYHSYQIKLLRKLDNLVSGSIMSSDTSAYQLIDRGMYST